MFQNARTQKANVESGPQLLPMMGTLLLLMAMTMKALAMALAYGDSKKIWTSSDLMRRLNRMSQKESPIKPVLIRMDM